MSPNTGMISNPKKPSARANGQIIRPITRLEYFSVMQLISSTMNLLFVIHNGLYMCNLLIHSLRVPISA
jgi:hypothetical protein